MSTKPKNKTKNKIFFLHIKEERRNSNVESFHSSDLVDKMEGAVTFENFKECILRNMDIPSKNKVLVEKQVQSSSNTSIPNNSFSNRKESSQKVESIEPINEGSLKDINRENSLIYNKEKSQTLVSEKAPSIVDENVDYNNISEADLIRIQNNQLKRLEYEARNKNKIEEKKKEEEERLLKQKEAEERENQEKVRDSLNKLNPEPEANENSTMIILRYPHTDERVERRFSKTDKIEQLYFFVSTLGKEIFEESGEFELIQPFPFKIYNEKEKTFEEEKLYPNAVLQIREV